MMPDTRRGEMSPEEAQKLIERMAHYGARISVADPRVSSSRDWILTSVGLCIIAVGGWLITSVNSLNEKHFLDVSQALMIK